MGEGLSGVGQSVSGPGPPRSITCIGGISGEKNNQIRTRRTLPRPGATHPGQGQPRLWALWDRDRAWMVAVAVQAGAGPGPPPCDGRSAQESRPVGNPSASVFHWMDRSTRPLTPSRRSSAWRLRQPASWTRRGQHSMPRGCMGRCGRAREGVAIDARRRYGSLRSGGAVGVADSERVTGPGIVGGARLPPCRSRRQRAAEGSATSLRSVSMHRIERINESIWPWNRMSAPT